MIALLRGQLVEDDGHRAIIDVQGVGYEVYVTGRDLTTWKSHTDDTLVHVSTQVREDAIQLFGFANADHRRAFEVMLGVSGVGPRVALSALDALPLSTLRTAIETDDLRTLTGISGVGKKTAQRMALELKGKLPASFLPSTTATPSIATPSNEPDPLDLALQQLGYNKTEIERARANLLAAGVDDSAPVAERLRSALTSMYQDRRL